jgi:hypothetical protein
LDLAQEAELEWDLHRQELEWEAESERELDQHHPEPDQLE